MGLENPERRKQGGVRGRSMRTVAVGVGWKGYPGLLRSSMGLENPGTQGWVG